MQVFYVNIGGGEPTVRPDFWELVDYATAHHVGVKFSTNGVRITPEVAAKLAASDYVDVQISLDGATAEVNDAVRGPGFVRDGRSGRWRTSPTPGFKDAKISVVVTRHNVDQLDEFKALWQTRYGATLRITRLRPSGRGADVWDELHPTAGAAGAALRLAGRRAATACSPATPSSTCPALVSRARWPASTCAAPAAWSASSTRSATSTPARSPSTTGSSPETSCPTAAFDNVWKNAQLFRELREPQSAGACGSCGHYDSCRGGCMAAKFFTGLPLDGPDPECVQGYGDPALAHERDKPKPSGDHSRRRPSKGPVPLTLLTKPPAQEVLQRKSGLDMARDNWFETVAIAQQRAKKRLPKSVYSALLAASEKGITVADNVDAFGELGFAPHVIGAIEKRDLATTVMGQEISLPVVISPTGVQAVHPDGEVAVARAAAATRHRDGPVVVREQADRRGRRRQPEDCSSRSTGSAAGTRSPRGSSAPGRPVRSA